MITDERMTVGRDIKINKPSDEVYKDIRRHPLQISMGVSGGLPVPYKLCHFFVRKVKHVKESGGSIPEMQQETPEILISQQEDGGPPEVVECENLDRSNAGGRIRAFAAFSSLQEISLL